MTGAHVTGAGFGAAVGAAVSWAARRYLGVDVTAADASFVGGAALAAGVGLGHVWSTTGLIPAIRQGIFGQKVEVPARTSVVAPAATVPTPAPPVTPQA